MEANNMFEMLPEGEAGEAEMDIEEEGLIREEFGQTEGSVGDKEISDKFGTEIYKSLIGKSSVVQVNVVLTDSNGVSKSCDGSSSAEAVENGLLTSEYLTSPSNCRRGVKRARLIDDEVQPSVHVSYSSLTRESKQKLEELMQLWSTWHAQHVSSLQSSIQVLESGEQTFFPALHVGKKQSHVMFWMDHQPSKVQGNGQIVLENDVPLYDRDYGLGLTLVDDSSNVEGGQKIIGDASRCFNCGGYSHSLKDCPRPRNNVAVTNARNVHMSKRNQTSASRISTRYYESAFAGKFKGLKPGTLDAETRKLLGLGELDPPPWHARMRELGYPPGYLVPEGDDEDKESGITIFADGESKAQDLEEKEDEESKTMRKANPKKPPPQLKKVVEFPGINGPVPKDADERKWIGPSNSSSDLIMQHGSHHRPPHQHQPPTMVEAAAAAACGSRTYSISYNDKHYRVSSFASYSRSREEENPPPPGTTESPVSLFHSPLERRYSSSSSFGFVGGYLRPDIHSPREDPLGLHRRSLLYDSTLPHSYPGSSRFWGSDHGRRDDDAAFRAEELSRPLEILHRDYMHGSPHY